MSHYPIEVRPTVTTLEREAEHDDSPRMIHVHFAGHSHSLCGNPVREELPYDPDAIDCVVCAELDPLCEAGLWP